MKETPTEREKEELRARAGGSVAFAFPQSDLMGFTCDYQCLLICCALSCNSNNRTHIQRVRPRERKRVKRV